MQGRDMEPRHYFQCKISELIQKCEVYLEEYNLENAYSSTRQTMKLILFLDACEHIARIARILR